MTGTALAQPPRPVLVAFAGLVVALLAGVAEAIEQSALLLERDEVDVAGLATGLTVRLGIYLVVLLVAIRMTHGARWARLLLTFGIGVIGLLSLIIEPLAALLSADRFGDLFAHLSIESVVIGLFRTIHVVAVLIAIPAMYHPAARRFFRRA
ncbi:hypothetical protein F3087_20935 [Nocardia colli]|uniref:Uncharacterized protein n=1 Tax=Nocardia colli TaxID=2545717 RepID=A0A5N0ED42_9NOCA|nr:hypothetical protein [Nocardia colli]KAA8886700.1 hypothetical protein F3087_20935 [Nocardia colli]